MSQVFFCFGKNDFCTDYKVPNACLYCGKMNGKGGEIRPVTEPPRLNRSAWEPCEHCKPSKSPLDRWGPHQFPIDGNEIYCYDIDDGWEGEEINFCPWCSRPLTDAAWKILEERLEGAK